MRDGEADIHTGAVALVGSGEYTDAMNETDQVLLETVGGAAHARVVLLPTASGLEAEGPRYWNDLGRDHFARLGVTDIRPAWIIDRKSADDPAQVELLRDANFFYFSGGKPSHVIESLRGTRAWERIVAAYQAGAVLAGCSAGAMALSEKTFAFSIRLSHGKIGWTDALNVVPGIIVFPHFDRMMRFPSEVAFHQIVKSAPDGCTVLGIDEDTALVRANGNGNGMASSWRVLGRQTVNVFERHREPRVLHSGDEITL